MSCQSRKYQNKKGQENWIFHSMDYNLSPQDIHPIPKDKETSKSLPITKQSALFVNELSTYPGLFVAAKTDPMGSKTLRKLVREFFTCIQ